MTKRALGDGADEIDAVLPYHAWLHGDEEGAADLLDRVRETVNERSDLSHGDGLFKVIIETGALPDRAAIDRATHFAIAHGADFVKTSTGKIEVSATPEAAEIVLEAIEVSGMPVGFKASGGVKTLADARIYLDLADRIMGPGWVSPDTFRFGASGLLDALLATTVRRLRSARSGVVRDSTAGRRRRVEHPPGLVGVEHALVDHDVDDRAAPRPGRGARSRRPARSRRSG